MLAASKLQVSKTDVHESQKSKHKESTHMQKGALIEVLEQTNGQVSERSIRETTECKQRTKGKRRVGSKESN
ncbi:hypothetical protein DPMN_031897 [Dreissena polymorpha]|uniref:Uncharacterized protein n=1 Tax=Dreissena polymorpha TaxID=45954 RepID=A0A9D4M0U7_DREPO|nr:hypothetical protein DPMN_031897 [Dreissena polymorpha]